MSLYPTLTQMGVKRFDEITKYAVRHQGDTDILKIYYKRPKGSFLPRSRKFSFVRGRNSMPLEARNSNAAMDMSTVSPQLVKALNELDELKAERKHIDPVDAKEKLIAHIDHLERVTNEKIAKLQRMIDQMD